MPLPRNHPRENPETGYRPTARWKNLWVDVKTNTHGFRNFRSVLLEMAYWLAQNPKSRGLLVLAESRITQNRLYEEMQRAGRVLHPEALNRLSVALSKDGRTSGLPKNLGNEFSSWLDTLLRKGPPPARSRESFYLILEILVHQWLLGKGPMTTDWLMKTSGCSYPTVAGALGRLAHSLNRSSDRKVELRHFPMEEWARLLAASERIRSTMRFADASGKPRPLEDHVRRLEKMKVPNLALGGALGARHYHPPLDLIGSPALNFSLHCPAGEMDLDFIGKMDPALKPVRDPQSPAHVVVHAVRRPNAFFMPRNGGLSWADPVECLLDLQEVKLEAQAGEFLDALRKRAEKPLS